MNEEKLYDAASQGRKDEVRRILVDCPDIDVNFAEETGGWSSALHIAVWRDDPIITSLLLAHPAIDPNVQDGAGQTPLATACTIDGGMCFRMLLRNPKSDFSIADDFERIPFLRIAQRAAITNAKWWISFERPVDFGEEGRRTDLLMAARRGMNDHDPEHQSAKADMVSLLERYREDPDGVRQEARVSLGWYNLVAAELFALVVFFCDGLLRIREVGKEEEPRGSEEIRRFLRISGQLPLELQMVLCRRGVGSSLGNIAVNDSEAAFLDLAKKSW